jgi:hypothetical protein
MITYGYNGHATRYTRIVARNVILSDIMRIANLNDYSQKCENTLAFLCSVVNYLEGVLGK